MRNTPPGAASLIRKRCNMYAVIETGGKQYRVSQGDVIYIEKLDVEAGQEIIFDKVIALSTDTMKIGTPTVEGATVKGTVVKNGKNKKITVFTYKAKKNVHRKLGHRQPYTKVQIENILGE